MSIENILENIKNAQIGYCPKKPTREPESMNKHGYRGVTYIKKDDRYAARIKINGIRYHLGNFKSAKEASEAYQEALKSIK